MSEQEGYLTARWAGVRDTLYDDVYAKEHAAACARLRGMAGEQAAERLINGLYEERDGAETSGGSGCAIELIELAKIATALPAEPDAPKFNRPGECKVLAVMLRSLECARDRITDMASAQDTTWNDWDASCDVDNAISVAKARIAELEASARELAAAPHRVDGTPRDLATAALLDHIRSCIRGAETRGEEAGFTEMLELAQVATAQPPVPFVENMVSARLKLYRVLSSASASMDLRTRTDDNAKEIEAVLDDLRSGRLVVGTQRACCTADPCVLDALQTMWGTLSDSAWQASEEGVRISELIHRLESGQQLPARSSPELLECSAYVVRAAEGAMRRVANCAQVPLGVVPDEEPVEVALTVGGLRQLKSAIAASASDPFQEYRPTRGELEEHLERLAQEQYPSPAALLRAFLVWHIGVQKGEPVWIEELEAPDLFLEKWPELKDAVLRNIRGACASARASELHLLKQLQDAIESGTVDQLVR